MDPLQIVLIVLALVAIWAVIELALVLRRARSTVDSLDKTVGSINDTIAQTKPVIEHLDETLTDVKPVMAKLDTSLEELQPALTQVEPLLRQGSIAVEALSADLIEVNGVLRDVSEVTGSMSSASGAVSGIASAASEKVQRLLNRHREENTTGERTLTEATEADVPEEPQGESEVPAQADENQGAHSGHPSRSYYTYGAKPADSVQEGSDD